MELTKYIKIILTGMILWDWSLHVVALFNIKEYHPFYPVFPSILIYQIFWSVYWGIALMLSIILLKN